MPRISVKKWLWRNQRDTKGSQGVCMCTVGGENYGSNANEKPHQWVRGVCWPRPLDVEVKRLRDCSLSAEAIAFRLRITKGKVERLLNGTLELDPAEPLSWVWVDIDEPGYRFKVEKGGNSLIRLIRQEELIGLTNIQKIALGWDSVLIGEGESRKYRIIYPQRQHPNFPRRKTPWSPWFFGHRTSRLYVNRRKQYSAVIWSGRRNITLDGRVLLDSLWYQRQREAEAIIMRGRQ